MKQHIRRFHGQISISSPYPALEVLGSLRASLVDDSMSFPVKPMSRVYHWVGTIQNDSFRFSKFMWFTGRLRPICSGVVVTRGGESLIKARVYSIALLPVPFVLVYLALYAFGKAGGNSLIALGSIVFVFTVISGYLRGFSEIAVLLSDIASGSARTVD